MSREGGLVKVVYNQPRQIKELKNVTDIAYSLGHFYAVINRQDIVNWDTIYDAEHNSHWDAVGVTQIQTLGSRPGVKAIVAYTHEVWNSPSLHALVVLYDNGLVKGWGVNKSGMIAEKFTVEGVELATVPGASQIDFNGQHVAVLNAEGTPLYWGGCVMHDANGKKLYESSDIRGQGKETVADVRGFISDVSSISLQKGPQYDGMETDDNQSYSAFIKRDGSVWKAHAPIPKELSPIQCGQNFDPEYYRQAVKIAGGKVPAVQIYVNAGSVTMLDAEHKLWNASLQNVEPPSFDYQLAFGTYKMKW